MDLGVRQPPCSLNRDTRHSIEVGRDFDVGGDCDVWVVDSDGFYDTFVMHDGLRLGDDVMEDGNDDDQFQEQDPTADYPHNTSSSPPETSLATPTLKSCPCDAKMGI